VNINAFRFGRRQDGLDRGADALGQVDDADVHGRTAGDDAGHVEQFVNQVHLPRGVVEDRLDGPGRACLVQCVTAQHRRPAQDRTQRRAELVRDN